MRILSLSLDASILDPQSAAAKRQALIYAGHEAVIAVIAPGEAKDFELAPGIRVRTLGGLSKFGAFMHAYVHLTFVENPDVVTAQEPIYSGYLASRIARRFHCGLHVQDHSGMFSRKPSGLRESILRSYAKHLVRKANRVRTVSQRGKRGLVAIGVPESRIDVIPIATDVQRLSRVDRSSSLPNEILCVSRLEPEKGIDVLLHAFAELRKKHPQAALVIVGDGSLRKGLEHIAYRLHIKDAVLFTGKQNDVRPYLARAGVYVQPSRFEGWGLSVIEAAAVGMPIVMTDVGCADEVIKDGESGLIVPPSDMKALAAAIERLMNDAALQKSLGESAKRAASLLPGPEATADAIRVSFLAARR